MLTAGSKIDERMPVWSALSELFLDTELQKEDHERIATVLAASPYSESKLEEILRFEVTPVLRGNMLSMAGVWSGFDEDWLREKLAPNIERRPFFRLGVFWMIRSHWKEVIREVIALRAK